MSKAELRDPEAFVNDLAARAKPDDAERLHAQFERKLEAVADSAKPEMIEKLRVLWAMFNDAEAELGWSSRALIMAALGYFVSPLDVVPDFAGKAGYVDDALVIDAVYARLGDKTQAYRSK